LNFVRGSSLSPDAGINPARTQDHKRQVSRMKATLFVLRFNELSGRGPSDARELYFIFVLNITALPEIFNGL
jgi:hypothetical protein